MSCILGATVPTLLTFAVHWASGRLGQFALAYEWPLWLEVWNCVGWWLCVCVLLLGFTSMQRDIAWMALKQASTLWVIAMTGFSSRSTHGARSECQRRALPAQSVVARVRP